MEVVIIYSGSMTFLRLLLIGVHRYMTNYTVTVIVAHADDYDMQYLYQRKDINRVIDFRYLPRKLHHDILNKFVFEHYYRLPIGLYLHTDIHIMDGRWIKEWKSLVPERKMVAACVERQGDWLVGCAYNGQQVDTCVLAMDNDYVANLGIPFDYVFTDDRLITEELNGFNLGHWYQNKYFYDTFTLIFAEMLSAGIPAGIKPEEDTLQPKIIHFQSIDSHLVFYANQLDMLNAHRDCIRNAWFQEDSSFLAEVRKDGYPYGRADNFLQIEVD